MPIGATESPLTSLYNTGGNYDFSYLTYPLHFDDLASQGHYINFFINATWGSQYWNGDDYGKSGPTNDTDFFKHVWQPAAGAQGGPYKYTTAKTPGGNLGPGGGEVTAGGYTVKANAQRRITQAISLYIPDSMAFSSSYDWQDASLTEFGGSFLKYGQMGAGVIKSVKDQIENRTYEAFRSISPALLEAILGSMSNSGKSASDFVGGVAGFAVNPQLFVLFRSIDFRRFQLDFIFTPRNETEAANIRNIIKAFRFHAAPEIAENFGRYFIAPSTFNMEIMYKGELNKNVNQFETLIAERIFIDYSPYGWSCYNDGMPVQTLLSIAFKEIELITKEKVNKNF